MQPRAPGIALVAPPSRRAFPCNESVAPAGIPSARRNNVLPDGLIMAAPPQREARRAAALICPDGAGQAGLDPAGEGRERKWSGWKEGGQTMQNGPECLPKYHGPGPEGVMPKAFPVIDPEPPASPVP